MSEINFFNTDCVEFMKTKPDNYYDLAIVDPPYGINAPTMQMGSNPNRNEKGQYPGISTAVKLKKGDSFHGRGKLKDRILNRMNTEWDCLPPSAEYFKELFRVSKNQIIWGGNYFPLPPCRGFIIWNKNQPWENFSQAEFAWTSFDMPSKVFTFSNRGGSNSETKIHPTQKDIELYKFCLKLANTNDRILDTHGGSMSSAIACDMLNYQMDICELDTEYFETALNRFKKYKTKKEEIKTLGYAKTELEKTNPLLF